MLVYRDPLFEVEDPAARLAALAAAAGDVAPASGDPWRDYVIDRVVYADNPWTRDAERRGVAACDGWLGAAAAEDLGRLEALAASPPAPAVRGSWPAPTGGRAAPAAERDGRPPRGAPSAGAAELAGLLATREGWPACLPRLAAHHAVSGCGDMARHRAFRWRHGGLEPVGHPEAATLDALIGYDAQKAEVVANTERFLRGLPARDVLLYGDRGTGKSHTVKALLTAYGERGLRLVEADRHVGADFWDLAARIRGRRQRFILFLDDLSFEAAEGEFRSLKAVLEGGVEARPDNLLVYATSNRRHLVAESFAEREAPHGRDNVEEKLSLADRFGLTVIYPGPDQQAYLEIVAGLCRQRGVEVPAAALRERALRSGLWGNGASGRTARRLVDLLVAEAAEARP